MATRRRVPRKPIAMEAMAMTAGPVRNLMAMAKAATEFPHAIIFGCSPIKIPFVFSTVRIHKQQSPVNFQSHSLQRYHLNPLKPTRERKKKLKEREKKKHEFTVQLLPLIWTAMEGITLTPAHPIHGPPS